MTPNEGANRAPKSQRWGILMPRTTIKRKRIVWGESGSDEHGLTVAAEERKEQPGTVRLKFWVSERKTYEWVPLPSICIRNADGTINRQQVNIVRTLLAAAVLARSEGRPVAPLIRDLLGMHCSDRPAEVPREGTRAVTDQVSTDCIDAASATNTQEVAAPAPGAEVAPVAGTVAPEPTAETVTLGDALDLYFRLDGGYFDEKTKQRGNEIGYAGDVLGSFSRDLLVRDIGAKFFRRVWVAFAERYERTELRKFYPGRPRSFDPMLHVEPGTLLPRAVCIRWGGMTHCEKTIEFLIRFFDWLRSEDLKRRAIKPRKNWKRILRKKWKKITREESPRAATDDGPRFEEPELAQLYVTSKESEPRVRLALELAFEARLGQVVRTMRSAYEPDEGPYGYIRTFGEDRKDGVGMYLTADQRVLLDYEMAHGYLRGPETALREKKIMGYPLFFGGRLTAYRDYTKPLQPLSSSGLRKIFNALEKDAGVAHVRGRGWYGLRRGGADLSEDVADVSKEELERIQRESEERERTLNSITGHSQTASRKRYQKKEAPSTLHRAAAVRGKTRRRLADGTRVPKPSEPDQ